MNRDNLHIRYERSTIDALLRATDAWCVIVGFAAAALDHRIEVDARFYLATAITIFVVLLIGEFTGIYRSRRGVAIRRELALVMLTWLYSLATLLAIGFLTRYTDDVPRFGVILGAATIAAGLVLSRGGWRSLQRWRRSHGYGVRRFAIVGVNDLGIRLAQNLEAAPELGLRLLGFFDDRPSRRTGELPEEIGQRLGDIPELVEAARQGRVDRVYITLPMRAEKRVRELLNQLADTTASVYIVPDFFVFELLHSRWTDIKGLPVVSVFENPFYGVDGMLKRVCDVVLASLLLAISAGPMLLIAALVKGTSPGPVFFRQKRYGLDGREILVWKFRTMRVMENGAEVRQATQNDPRVTTLGGLLRRTSLDELPQLLNVLEGSMSLVGPRPHASAQNERYRRLIPGYMLRHKVKPGITGLAQVLGWRGETDTLDKMLRRVECDLQYIREWSLSLDLTILFKTFWVVASGRNAY